MKYLAFAKAADSLVEYLSSETLKLPDEAKANRFSALENLVPQLYASLAAQLYKPILNVEQAHNMMAKAIMLADICYADLDVLRDEYLSSQ